MSLDQIKLEIENVKNNESKLYSYLYDLTYNEISKNTRFLETIYSSFLNDERIEIKRVAIYCLLFGLQIAKPEYKKFAMVQLQNKKNDLDLRQTCVMGLAQAYKGTDDKELLSIFYSLFNDLEEDEDIKTECFMGMMKIHGLNSTEVVHKNMNKVIVHKDDLHLAAFEREISEIKKMIN